MLNTLKKILDPRLRGDDKKVVAKKIIFSGRVQGVFFRSFVKTNADKHGIKGYVKNLDDGNVEAVFEGEKERIEELIEACQKGPRVARVQKVITEDIPAKSYRNFEIIY